MATKARQSIVFRDAEDSSDEECIPAPVSRPPRQPKIVDSDDEEEESNNSRVQPPRPSVLRPSLGRRRRRSSARFLSMRRSSVGGGNNNSEMTDLYKQAIRLNAENKINASNSWNLPLIENLDHFVQDANFTKASCTLDASVKIYGYRVDDVHLTSYKVLANLHRNEKPSAEPSVVEDDEALDDDEDGDPEGGGGRKATKKSSSGPTLETNAANLNVGQLEAAFDIDPLFHKMNKAREGTMLLVHLPLSSEQCEIVFDSSLPTPPPAPLREDPVADVGLDQEHLTLAHSLRSMREEQAHLEEEGFVGVPKTPSIRRYAPRDQDESEADKSIHAEALERSRLPTPRDLDAGASPMLAQSQEDVPPPFDDNDDAPMAWDDGGDDDDDFEAFVAAAGRVSAISAVPRPVVLEQGDFWKRAQAWKDNTWAGAAHWKKATITAKQASKKPRSTAKTTQSVIDLTQAPDVSHLFKDSKKGRLDWTKTTVDKYTEKDHLLPTDVGLGGEALSSLFLKPKAVVMQEAETTKMVGFDLPTTNWDDGDDDDGGYAMNDDYDDDEFVLSDVRKVDQVEIGYATVAKKVDVKRLKVDLWNELEERLSEEKEEAEPLSFHNVVHDLEASKSQPDVTLPFYFICILHLANEKGLRLASEGLEDFTIYEDKEAQESLGV